MKNQLQKGDNMKGNETGLFSVNKNIRRKNPHMYRKIKWRMNELLLVLTSHFFFFVPVVFFSFFGNQVRILFLHS